MQAKDNRPTPVTIAPADGKPMIPMTVAAAPEMLSVRFLTPLTLGKLQPFVFVDLRDGRHSVAIRGDRVLVSMWDEDEWADVPLSQCIFRWRIDGKTAADAAGKLWP